MSDTKTVNPYESASLDDAPRSGLTHLQASLVVILAIVLLLRGGFMLLSWSMLLSSGVKLDSHFYAATFAEDAIYGLSAFIGGLMLLPRLKTGWWFALIHWCWYVACEICIVSSAAALGWHLPIHPTAPTLYRAIGFTALLAICGLSILLWRPIATACNAPVSKRYLAATAVMISSVALAFAINGWMSQR